MNFENWIMDFPEGLDVPSIEFARQVWQAAQAAERERAKVLVDILKDAKDYIPLAPIECNGNKCRELWCASCFDDETVSEAIVRSASTLKKASAAIAKYEGEK